MRNATEHQVENGPRMFYVYNGIYSIVSSSGNTLFEGPFDECMDEYERLCGTDLDISDWQPNQIIL